MSAWLIGVTLGWLACQPEIAHWCDAAGCRPAAGPALLLVNPANRTVARCDVVGVCPAAPYVAGQSGGATRLVVNGGAAVLSVDAGGRFTDAAFLGGAALVSTGVCIEAPPK